jgi:hypothetical protein
MQIQSNGGSSNLRFSSAIKSRWWELFRFQDDKFIVNDKGKVVEVSGGLDKENQNIMVNTKHGRVNQQW